MGTGQADFQEAERYLHGLGADADTVMHWRAIWPKERTPALNTRNLTGTFRELQTKLEQLNQQGFGIFVTINEGGTKTAEISNIRAIFADFDDPNSKPQDVINRLTPSMVVQSSAAHKVHVYYRVADCPVDLAKPIQQAVVDQYGADDNAKDIARVLRVPGFWHTKAEPVMVRIISQTEAIYSYQQIIDALGLDISAKRKRSKGKVAARASEGAMAAFKGVASNLKQEVDVEKLRAALAVLSADNYADWVNYGLAIKFAMGDEGYPIWLEWSRTSEKFNEDAAQAKWDELTPTGDITVRTIFHDAKEPVEVLKDYALDDKGLYFVVQDKDDPNKKHRIRLCNYLAVVAVTRDNHGTNYGRYIKFKNTDGVMQSMSVPAESIHDPKGLIEILTNRGADVSTNTKNKERLSHYLMESKPSKRITCVTQPGWVAGGAFATINGTIMPPGSDEIVYQGTTGAPLVESGTLESWQQTVAAKAVGNSRLVVSISTACAGALLYKLSHDNFGIHHIGGSSLGKSTTLFVAGSVYGNPDTFCGSWRGTDNGHESGAAERNDLTMCLDEMKEAKHTLGESVYMLANGKGKARADRNGDAKTIKTWRNTLVSTGEMTVEEHLAEYKGTMQAGMDVRLLNIPIPDVYGIYEKLHGHESGANLSEALKHATRENHGVVGRIWLEKLVEFFAKHPDASKQINAKINEFVSTIAGADKPGQIQRVAKHFGLIYAAGNLATAFGLTGWPKGEVAKAVKACYQAWLDKRGGDEKSHEELSVVRRFSSFVFQHKVRFQNGENEHVNNPMSDEHAPPNRLGWYWKGAYYIRESELELICAELKLNGGAQVAEAALRDAKIIVSNRDKEGDVANTKINAVQRRAHKLVFPDGEMEVAQ